MEEENPDATTAVAEPEAAAPVEEPASAPEPAAAEPEAAPAKAPAAQQSPLDLFLDRVNVRLAALEASAHSGHNFSLDQSAVEEIAARVLALVNESVSKHLG